MIEVIFKKMNDFELAHIFECGQCFRWHKEIDDSYTGITHFGVLNIRKKEDTVFIKGEFIKENSLIKRNTTGNIAYVRKCIENYFDLDTNYAELKEKLLTKDIYLKKAIEYGFGIRILNQDPWEMLISYIISAANNIPRISKIIENLSETYGKEITFEGKKYYLFPTPEELSRVSIQSLRALNLGFRDKYVHDAIRLVTTKQIDLSLICKMEYKEAKKELIKINGIGDKVADCILLFSMKKREAFPVDTWIKKVMMELYLGSCDVKKISKFAINYFGKECGIAQQYLFYYIRNREEELIGEKNEA